MRDARATTDDDRHRSTRPGTRPATAPITGGWSHGPGVGRTDRMTDDHDDGERLRPDRGRHRDEGRSGGAVGPDVGRAAPGVTGGSITAPARTARTGPDGPSCEPSPDGGRSVPGASAPPTADRPAVVGGGSGRDERDCRRRSRDSGGGASPLWGVRVDAGRRRSGQHRCARRSHRRERSDRHRDHPAGRRGRVRGVRTVRRRRTDGPREGVARDLLWRRCVVREFLEATADVSLDDGAAYRIGRIVPRDGLAELGDRLTRPCTRRCEATDRTDCDRLTR